MIIIVYSETQEHSLVNNLGYSEYSYYFVLKSYKPMLESLGIVVTVDHPATQVDPIYDFCQAVGEQCVFLSFTPPHKTQLDLRCPTVPVFAWEFGTIPNESWGGDLRNDWALILRRFPLAITHSEFAKRAILQAMGGDYEVYVMPSPIWENYQSIDVLDKPKTLKVQGRVTDSYELNTPANKDVAVGKASGSVSMTLDLSEIMASKKQQPAPGVKELEIKGTVYTYVFNPDDGRKNWADLLRAFCYAFKEESEACLILKLIGDRSGNAVQRFRQEILQNMPMKCRVIVVYGFLPGEGYRNLIRASHFALNSSYGEGQCLPMMEFMSAGLPSVTPLHTAMEDYADESSSVPVNFSNELTSWPHDTRKKIRTHRFRVDQFSMIEAFTKAQSKAADDKVYAAMSKAAKQNLKNYCAREKIEPLMQEVLDKLVEGQKTVEKKEATS